MNLKEKNITIFGGSGFLGTQLVRALTKEGALVKVVCRFPDRARHLRTNGPTGRVVIQAGNVRSEQVVEKALEDADICINLVGILFQKGKQRFDEIQSKSAERIARIAAEKGVSKMVQLSALGVERSGSSRYARSKLLGEKAVLGAFPKAVILRPSVIFGADDEFFNKFASILSVAPTFPVFGGGHNTFQPIFVGDVVKAILNAITNDKLEGDIFELGGKEVMSFKQVLEYTKTQIGAKSCLMPVPFFVASFMASFMELLPTPPLTRDQVKMLHVNNVVADDALTIQDMGVKDLTSVDMVVPHYLKRFKKV